MSNEKWTELVQGLGASERAERLKAVEVLLAQPEAISDPIESELYILRDQLQKPHA